jgi:SNF2 family DNA or RNA helicase
MSIATCQLPGKYRWALTGKMVVVTINPLVTSLLSGTPLQNNVEELFPLLKFLRIRPLNDWIEYKTVIADPVKKGRTKSAMKRLHVSSLLSTGGRRLSLLLRSF